jgi:hypothetical protein
MVPLPHRQSVKCQAGFITLALAQTRMIARQFSRRHICGPLLRLQHTVLIDPATPEKAVAHHVPAKQKQDRDEDDQKRNFHQSWPR